MTKFIHDMQHAYTKPAAKGVVITKECTIITN